MDALPLSPTVKPAQFRQAEHAHQKTLGEDELRRMNAYWRAANYLSVGQLYLYDNPLLREKLTLAMSNHSWWDIGAPRPARISSICI